MNFEPIWMEGKKRKKTLTVTVLGQILPAAIDKM